MTNLKSVPVPEKRIIMKEVGDETMLISEKENLIHTLDEVGSVIWRSIDGKKNLSMILDVICSEFDVGRKDAEGDLLSFIEQLKKAGVITLQKK